MNKIEKLGIAGIILLWIPLVIRFEEYTDLGINVLTGLFILSILLFIFGDSLLSRKPKEIGGMK